MSEKFKMPETREEAVKRKEELFEKINKYNEEYFSGNPTLSEEEINLIQEEYQFLDDLVDIEEDYAKVDEPKEQKFLDKVNIFVWIYAMFALFSGFYFIQQRFGFYVILMNIFDETLFSTLTNVELWFLVFGSFVAYPVVLAVIGLILKIFAFKKSAESRKAFKYVFLGQIAFLIINFVITYFTLVDLVYLQLKP